MGFSCGIVGLPNVGKSTIFNALTAMKVDASNYPFCTIEPNLGIVKVPDGRLEELAGYFPRDKLVPAAMTFVDIAGLAKGASRGEGLGNKFLAHIREVNAVAHVVRCFEAPDVVHATGKVDPAEDAATVDTELILADLETVSRNYATLEKTARAGGKEAQALFSVLSKIRSGLDAGKPARALGLTEAQLQEVREYNLLTAKKVLYVANVNDSDAADPEANPNVGRLKEYASREGAPVVTICGKIEAEIAEMPEGEKERMLGDFGIAEPGLDRLIRAGYRLLGLETFFTVGDAELRAWTFRKGSKAPQAAGLVHSDFERGFIRAEVFRLDDLRRHGGDSAMREAGTVRQEGKEYVVQDGDIVRFRFAV